MLNAIEILSASTVKRLVLEQNRFLKREYWVTSCILKLRVASYELNLELQFSKTCAELNFETASC